MKYVLIYILITGSTGNVVEFNSRMACENAQEVMTRQKSKLRKIVTFSWCFPKGEDPNSSEYVPTNHSRVTT